MKKMEQNKNNLDIFIPSQVKEPLFWKGYLIGSFIAIIATGAPRTVISVVQNLF